MSDSTPNLDPSSELPTSDSDRRLKLLVLKCMRQLSLLRVWAYGHWMRSVLVAAAILALVAVTIASWTYLAGVAIRSGQHSVEGAFAALDRGHYDEARMAVGSLLESGFLPRSEYGGPLFVLGAIKTHDAENQQAADRRRMEYLVASRYLNEARIYGIPPQYEALGSYLLGKSLVESGQFNEGIRVLDELLQRTAALDPALAIETHQLLAATCLWKPHPNPARALKHNAALLADADLPQAERADLLLQRIECLLRLDRFDEARQTLAELSEHDYRRATIELMRAKIALEEVAAAIGAADGADHSKLLSEMEENVVEAMTLLQSAAENDAQKSRITRQSAYLYGRSHELRGDADAALAQYLRVRQLYGDTFEGLAAALAEADHLRRKGDFPASVQSYRRVLEVFRNLPIYRSEVLPISQLRERLTDALKDFVDHRRFEETLTLVDHLPPLFSRTERLELRGGTLQQWGQTLVASADDDEPEAESLRRAGRHRLRAAGVAFEQLAEERFATRFYSSDLWNAAENFFHGHGFTRAIRLLHSYLDYEPELRNAQALLRLGQCYLATQQFAHSIAALEECIEFHPRDAATYRARIDCAKAYWHQGNTSQAEQLLRENLVGSSLRPSSREWKDSFFQLGMLLYETGRFEEAIYTLEEAIARYPHDPQRLTAQYLIAESYRRSGQALLERAREARTAAERDKGEQAATEQLQAALKHFEEVQVSITFKTHDLHRDPLIGAMLRNCYMFTGAVLFELGRYREAIEAYSNVASLYPDDPFVLETFVQIANCWRRLERHDNARGAIRQAQIALDELSADANFAGTTVLNREEWQMLLADMRRW